MQRTLRADKQTIWLHKFPGTRPKLWACSRTQLMSGPQENSFSVVFEFVAFADCTCHWGSALPAASLKDRKIGQQKLKSTQKGSKVTSAFFLLNSKSNI